MYPAPRLHEYTKSIELVENILEPRLEVVWPPFALHVYTGRLTLSVVRDDDLPELAELARTAHQAGRSPFRTAWTELPSPGYEQAFARYFWQQRLDWNEDYWSLPFAVRHDGQLVGIQQLSGRNFTQTGAVATSSWLAAGAQRLGIGTEMREAVLALAFDALGASEAVSGAFHFNTASLRVSERLGYERVGVDLVETPAGDVEEIRFRLSAAAWRLRERRRFLAHGLEDCLDLLGVGARVELAVSV